MGAIPPAVGYLCSEIGIWNLEPGTWNLKFEKSRGLRRGGEMSVGTGTPRSAGQGTFDVTILKIQLS
eukprot:SAG11_NODE_430_length_9532_cov_13.089685_3_plen_67_part_00